MPHIFPAIAAVPGSGNLNLLGVQTLSSNQATATFSSITQNYHALQLICNVRSTSVSALDALLVQFNGDSTAGHYGWSQIAYTSDTGLQLANNPTASYIYSGEFCSGSTDSHSFSIIDVIIGGYSSGGTFKFTTSNWTDTKYPSAVVDHGTNGGFWIGTAPVTSIVLSCSAIFIAGSTFVLYGL